MDRVRHGWYSWLSSPQARLGGSYFPRGQPQEAFWAGSTFRIVRAPPSNGRDAAPRQTDGARIYVGIAWGVAGRCLRPLAAPSKSHHPAPHHHWGVDFLAPTTTLPHSPPTKVSPPSTASMQQSPHRRSFSSINPHQHAGHLAEGIDASKGLHQGSL
ncbi:hypothetical protein BCR34DRAFT_157287 [Clohesyomyces aquaticus]|uniref:Uncharacterized protein n=1 Tax=Clohesyomyces aquaticus TaxID=1231657 RepID=A0A1Y1YJ78_9PLEO|nr:hypothetical protein BCR34DRAFT_157287 [Clohesyomyces aquaticus]